MSKLIIGNWKANPASLADAQRLLQALESSGIHELTDRAKTIICPPTIWLTALCRQFPNFVFGAQNTYPGDHGPYTGETTVDMLQGLGISHVILGHSERRRLLGESDAFVAMKTHSLIGRGMVPIVAVGTTISGNDEMSEIISQLDSILDALPAEQVNSVIFAYEPIWAISTTPGARPATPEYAIEVVRKIKGYIFEKTQQEPKIIYGGSVNDQSVATFTKFEEIAGVLPGAASLKPDIFAALVRAVASQ